MWNNHLIGHPHFQLSITTGRRDTWPPRKSGAPRPIRRSLDTARTLIHRRLQSGPCCLLPTSAAKRALLHRGMRRCISERLVRQVPRLLRHHPDDANSLSIQGGKHRASRCYSLKKEKQRSGYSCGFPQTGRNLHSITSCLISVVLVTLSCRVRTDQCHLHDDMISENWWLSNVFVSSVFRSGVRLSTFSDQGVQAGIFHHLCPSGGTSLRQRQPN
jgi:hypothetical protein